MPDPPADPRSDLEALCLDAFDRGISPGLREALEPLRLEIAERHGDAGLALLLYGSCLRADREGEALEGVPDLIYVVDSYERAYPVAKPRSPTPRESSPLKERTPRRARWLRRANRWLPPNVFPVFSPEPAPGPLQTKYALVSLADLARACRGEALDAFLWARLCQPSALVWWRDEAAKRAVATAAARAIESAVAMALPVLAGSRDTWVVEPEALWTRAFDETYRAEWRFEARQRSGELVRAELDYYTRATEGTLRSLCRRGALEREGARARVRIDRSWALGARRRWAWRRRRAKAIAALRLLKSALTFGDWVPYALWKMERHTGVRLEATEAQRRHPFLFGWPLIVRALRTRLLR